MKTFFVVLVSVVLLGFAQEETAKAQCPAGFSKITRVIMVNGCPYEAEICIKCATGPAPGLAEVIGVTKLPTTPPCTTGLNQSEVTSFIMGMVGTYSFLQSICTSLPSNPPPCPDNSTRFTIKFPLCWSIEKIEYFEEDYLIYSDCTPGTYCEVTYSYCYDPVAGEIVKNIFSQTLFGGPVSCTKEGWEIQIPIDYDDPTDCYIYRSECNP